MALTIGTGTGIGIDTGIPSWGSVPASAFFRAWMHGPLSLERASATPFHLATLLPLCAVIEGAHATPSVADAPTDKPRPDLVGLGAQPGFEPTQHRAYPSLRATSGLDQRHRGLPPT
eukprot:CAMPEP_0183359708 /NCGR_PEP_ID=MMETSP0164_2-20130417/53073_1 /TAXON_ID=221442 /ORGANISM="Coccolithus pelagicus ssp braarudi, Strain PLY182g" /LENGTH=116 /DNA_ID=CAMNT_0025533889 /DNA_START=207 /DNA_END=554 /DNA_ORIENTATION=-